MNFFDVFVLVILIWSGFNGFTKGFIISVASLVALLAGIFGAINFSSFITDILVRNNFHYEKYQDIIAFSITFILIVIGVHLLARLLNKLIEAVALGFVNRLAGLVFNIIKTALILSVLVVILNRINNKIPFIPQSKLNNSLFYMPLSRLAPAIFPYLKFERGIDQNNKTLQEEVLT